MSARNSRANKAAARERLRQERELQAKRDKRRRQLTVGLVGLGVLALTGGIGYAVVQANKPAHWEAAKDQSLVKPANTSGENGTTIVIGKKDAKKTLEIYEDARCPVCAGFEQAVGGELHKDVEEGKYKLQFVGATFLDGDDLTKGKIGAYGEGSKNTLSALGAALNVSTDAFLDYKAALYSAEFHPEESDDKFKDDAYLIKVANTVDALKDNKEFRKDVEDGTFDRWALEMSKKFAESGVGGTPTLKMGGDKLTVEGTNNPPMTVAQFRAAVDKALAK